MFTLSRRFADEIVAHALQDDPNEACGLLVGKGGQIEKLFRMTNIEASPVRYVMDPREQLNIMVEMDKNGWDLIAIYHSHTHSPAYPSATDVGLCYYPDSLYLIVSLEDHDKPCLRAFWIRDKIIQEEEFEVE